MPAIRPVTVDPRKPLVALSFAGSLCLTGSAWADERPAAMPVAHPASPASVTAAGAAHELPILLQARRLQSRPDLDATAEGDVEFRRGTLRIQADQVVYDIPQDLARALGHVRIERDGAVYSGPELSLQVQRFQGHFLEPRFDFPDRGTGGSAQRIDFLGPSRSRATAASYTSCPRDGPDEPDWVLQARSVHIDLDANEGVADGAVLRFLGVPILAWPVLSFPLTEARKSGWLPPSIGIDNRSGVELSVPYYWNIAPNRDATLAPRLITRRGIGLDAEFRYLDPAYQGRVAVDWLPHDNLFGSARRGVAWLHEGRLGGGLEYRADLVRVSDADWWKDFPDDSPSFTPRLLPLRAALERPFATRIGEGRAYLRTTRWQLLQAADSLIEAPFQRSAQLGVSFGGGRSGWQYTLEGEYNRFTLPDDRAPADTRSGGQRWHLLGELSHVVRHQGWWLVPRLAFNAARYDNDAITPAGQGLRSRVIPTVSLDTGLELERSTRAFGRDLLQTLEPRLRYVNTPYREQAGLPNYDSAGKDFNFATLYTDNSFSGVDRVSDAHQVTAGFTSRLLDAASGVEVLRVGLAQRYLLRTQRVTAQADGNPDGEPLTQSLSDALLLGSTSVLPGWRLEAALQYSPEISRSVRSIVTAQFTPGPFRTVAGTYRFARGFSEQFELGWQWPLFGTAAAAPPRSSGNGCGSAWYTVGRVNYSLKDSRVTDSVLGLEYDAGCWIARVVAMRLSTGRGEATTRLGLQLELSGFSKLNVGSNPLQVLKDNIPGYRLLREERDDGIPSSP